MSSFISSRDGVRSLAIVSSIVLAAGCGGHNHLSEYSFDRRSVALVYVAPPRPELVTGIYDIGDARDPMNVVLAASSGVAKEVEGRRARARLDSATAHVDVAALVSSRTLDRASRYLGATPTGDARRADFLLEVNMRSSGLDLRSQHAAYLFMNATATLIEARSGREIWSFDIDGHNRLTPFVAVGGGRFPTGAVTAGALSSVSVADFQQVLEQLADFSANEITDNLRDALRKVRDDRGR